MSTHLCAPKYFAPYPAGYEAADRTIAGHFCAGECLAGDKPCLPANSVLSELGSEHGHMAMGTLWLANCRKRHGHGYPLARVFCATKDLQISSFKPNMWAADSEKRVKANLYRPCTIHDLPGHTSAPQGRLTWGLLAVLKRPQAHAMEMWS